MNAIPEEQPASAAASRHRNYRNILIFLSLIEALACAAGIFFFLNQSGGDPLGQNIARGIAGIFALFLVLGALPALFFAWHGRFLFASGALVFGAPVILMAAWRSL